MKCPTKLITDNLGKLREDGLKSAVTGTDKPPSSRVDEKVDECAVIG